MANKYEQSFEEDLENICPICGTEFDWNNDIDISQYENGVRSVLICPNCDYKKVVSYETNEDIEDEMEEDDQWEDCEELEDDEQMSKEEMLEEMKENNWNHDLTEESSWEDIKDEYDIMIDEYSDDSYFFPNGRDHDAEDEDGPC